MKQGRTLQELAAELDRRYNVKKDYLVDTSKVHMDADSPDALLSIANDKTGETIILRVNEIAHNQIGSYLNIPAKYYDRMRRENPGLLAQNVNSWFTKEPEQRMLRTLDGTARAFLSKKYRRIDNFEIAQTVLPVIYDIVKENMDDCSFEVTDERMYLKVVNKRLMAEVAPNDIVQSGFMITNSEVGLGSFTVQPLIYRLVCSNGMVVNDAKMRKYHVGRGNEAAEDYTLFSDETLKADDKALMMKLQDIVKVVADQTRFDKVVDMMRNAKEAKIASDANIPAIVELASEDFGYTKREGQGILDYLIRGEDLSLYGFANAATRYAQDVDSYDRSTELESIGYSILGMSAKKWHNLNKDSAEKAVA